jgi:uncharacterized membrane-anchored protein YhcB (DUF1043 family)
MEYTSIFTPMLLIFTSFLAGLILGFIVSFLLAIKESKELGKELDKFRELYFEEVRKQFK